MQNKQRKTFENRGSWNRAKAKADKAELPPEKKKPEPIPADFEGKKAYLAKWAAENHIPGKIQGWYTTPTKPSTSDWRIVSLHMAKGCRILSIEGPYKGAKPPKLVLDVDAQIRKPHLSKFRGSILQIWFRSTGDGRYGLAVQNILHSSEATREFKTFMEYLEREHANDVLCCHQMQVLPVQSFDPAHPIPEARIDLKKGYGSEFLPIADSGKRFHILDWTPQAKEPWVGLPKKLKEIIHPAKDDKFLECYAGPGYIAESLSASFESVYAVDSRNLPRSTPNVRYIHAKFDKEFIPKFFSGKSKDGKWTVYIDPPDGKALAGNVIPALVACCPERILLNSSNLTIAAQEIKRFRREGFMLRKIIPLDLEPETPTFQAIFFFVPDRAGLLGHRAERTGEVIKKQEIPEERDRNAPKAIHFSQKRK